jgi:hypothetical protein
MLFGETAAVYYENQTEHINTCIVCSEHRIDVLKLVVHIATIVVWKANAGQLATRQLLTGRDCDQAN